MSTIAAELISLARRIGKWILQRVIQRGAVRLGHYMLERVDVFRRRLKTAKTDRRKRWLRGRIKRWERGGSWLLAWAEPVGDCVATEIDTLIAKTKGLPTIAACEKLGRAA